MLVGYSEYAQPFIQRFLGVSRVFQYKNLLVIQMSDGPHGEFVHPAFCQYGSIPVIPQASQDKAFLICVFVRILPLGMVSPTAAKRTLPREVLEVSVVQVTYRKT